MVKTKAILLKGSEHTLICLFSWFLSIRLIGLVNQIFGIYTPAACLLAVSLLLYVTLFIINKKHNVYNRAVNWLSFTEKARPWFKYVPFLVLVVSALTYNNSFEADYHLNTIDQLRSVWRIFRTMQGISFGAAQAFFALSIIALFRDVFWDLRNTYRVSEKRHAWLLPVSYWLIFAAVSIAFVAASRTIYVYDYTVYWEKGIHIASQFSSDPFIEIRRVFYTAPSEYNDYPAALLALFVMLFGKSRMVFVLGVSVYLLLASFMVLLLCLRLCKKPILSCLLVMVSFPILLYMARHGFLDFGTLIYSLLCLYLYFVPGIRKYPKMYILGIIGAWTFLFRRYMVVFVLAFSIVLLISEVRAFFINVNKTRDIVAKLTLYGMGMASALLLFFQKGIVTQLTTNYSDSYQYYQYGIAASIKGIIGYLGLVPILLFATSIVVLLLLKRQCLLVVSSMVGFLLSAFVLTRIQSPSVQHMMTLIPWMLIMFVLLYDHLLTVRAKVPLITLAGLTVVNFAVLFIPKLRDPMPFTSLKIERATNQNIGVYRDILTDVCAVRKGGSVYVIGSSSVLNKELFKNYALSTNQEELQVTVLNTAIVDHRDRTPLQLLTADFVILSEPLQYERGPEFQKVIKIPGEMVLAGKGFAAAFERVERAYILDNGTKVYVYHRIREVTITEKNGLLQALNREYPSEPELYPAMENQ